MKKHLESGRTEQKLHTRSKILEAANTLLENGKSLTMEAVADQAKISRATIYRYYSSIDSLSTELILHLNLPDTKIISEKFGNKELENAVLGIQKTYLKFILENEIASKKFLGAILSSTDTKLERGKNRLNALKKYFDSKELNMDDATEKKLIHIAVLLMGIESIIVTKDVCGLNNKESMETLQWGMEMILRGYKTS